MKRIMVFLMFLILLSGMAYSKTKTVYLVVPDAAIGTTNLKYYVIDTSGTLITDIIKTEIKTDNYEGNTALNLVKLEITTDKNILKMVAGYIGSDDKYYLLVSPDADTSNVETKLNDNGSNSPFDVFNGVSKFGNYSSYPGIKITDDVRLSMVPIEETSIKNFETIILENGTVEISGKSNFSPSNSENNELVFTYYDSSTETEVETEFKDDDSIFKFNKGNKPTETSPLEIEKVTKIYFRVKNDKDNDIAINGTAVEKNTIIDKEGEMTLQFYNDKYKNGKANGQWWLIASGNVNGGAGDTIVLLEDTGVAAESGIAVKSKVNNKSRARDTNIKTSLIDSDNFVIENIKE